MKGIKKKLSVILASLMLFCFTSCEEIVISVPSTSSTVRLSTKESSMEKHAHVFDRKVVSQKYKATDATCTESAKYYYSCVCKEKGTETFSYGEKLGHNYSDWNYSDHVNKNNYFTRSKTCKVCGDIIEEEIDSNKNLSINTYDYFTDKYSVLEYKKYYNDKRDNIVSIPSEYNNLPVVAIDSYVFNESSIEQINIPLSVTDIAPYAFCSCNNLTSIVIPDSVIEIGENVFERCENLVDIKLSDNLTYFSYGMFDSCGISNINVPNKVTRIEGECFYRCSNLKRISLPDSVLTVGNFVFSECQSLSEIKLSKKQEFISEFNFENCQNLQKIYFPKSVTEIKENAFAGACSSIEKIDIYYEGTEDDFKRINVLDGNDVLKEKGNIIYNFKF